MNDGGDPDAGAETGALAMDELADLTEQITRRLQDGEAVDLEEYARCFPRCAGPIRRLLPMLRGLANLARATEAGCDKRPPSGP
jgi:eukaryotic-like serine/threonine-protein kinase